MTTQAIVAYVPALHQGYLNFLEGHPGDIYLLGEPLLHKVPRLDRDIRAITPARIRQLLKGAELDNEIYLLETKADIAKLQSYDTITLPDEDISRQFAAKYLDGQEVRFVSIFLRWDRTISTATSEVNPNRKISQNKLDTELMIRARKEAQNSPDWWRQVGSLAVKDGAILLLAYNRPLVATNYTLDTFGDPRSDFDAGEYIEISKAIHSEAALIARAAARGTALQDTTLYVTTFPCPNCAKLIAEAGITQVYYQEGYSRLDAEDIFLTYGIELIQVNPT